MSMFENDGHDQDQSLKDKILKELIDHVEDLISGRMAPQEEKGVAVEVQAPDKAHLQEGLEKAGGVLDKLPTEEPREAGADEDDGKSDEERLAELMDGEDEDEEDEHEKR